ncbi:MAG: S8 family serine peptidase [Phaeodactylibacter sp.]|uniref:S8 family serine peptidase n=1 Tax=Phaeodactylibacter sp. TaxID=1940289 RepID=UPI0032EE481A
MKKTSIGAVIACFLFFALPAFGQESSEPDNPRQFYWVAFKDKANTPYAAKAPEAFLSPRAIARREKLGILITPTDFPPNPDYLEGVEAAGARVHHTSRWLNAATVYGEQSALPAIAVLPYVDTVWYAGPYRERDKASVERTKKMDKLKSKALTGQHYGYATKQIKAINGDSLHQAGYRGKGVLVAVMDGGFTGVDRSPFFDTLRAHNRLLRSMDMVDKDTLVWESSSHGTKVLSTMAANQPEVLVGTAPDATYVCIKTEDTRGEHRIEECHWVAGLEYADSLGADVINSSLGYTQFDEPDMNYGADDLTGHTSVASRAADIAAEKGILVVTSAGNEGSSPWRKIGIPADAAGAFSIGATALNGDLASFSSVGPTADRRIKPDIVAPGAWVTLADAYQYQVTIGSGTSFASPIVAGMVACLREAYPEVSVEEILDAIRNSGNQSDLPNVAVGYGIPDFIKAYEALHKQP